MANRLPIMPPEISGLSYVSPLGSGGFADVYLYRQAMPARQVAVKVFLKKFEANSSSAISFLAEANNLAKLGGHPNIVNIWDANISREGNPYISMEYCTSSLGKDWRSNPLSLERVLDVGVQIACALEMVHRSGLLHRDVKPSNILINSFGTPVLSDFGIAGEMSTTGTADQIAMSLPWSAPEVVTLQTLGTVASDVWSLGATLYSLLAGRTPFEVENSAQNDNEKLKSRIVRAIYTPIPRGGVPRIVEEVLNKAMSRDPKNRYGTMQEFAMALNDVQRELAFMVTRLSISVNEAVGLEIEEYPCGHPKLDATGLRIGVRIDNGNRRKRKGVEEANLDECPICSGQSVIDGKKKFRKKLNPLVVLLLGSVVLGFTVTLIVLKVTGGF